MLAEYFARKGKREAPSKEALPLDPISEKTVGRLKIEMLESRAPWAWMKPALEMLLKGVFTPQSDEEVRKTREPRVRTSDDAAGHVPLLLRINLFRRRRRGEKIRARCGLFTVPKKLDTTRLVFDARPANRLIKKLEGFILFGLDDLLDAYTTLAARGGKIYSFCCDYKHYFYQIPLHERLQSFFGVDNLAPLVMPMGFHSAPLFGSQKVCGRCRFRRPENSPGKDPLMFSPADPICVRIRILPSRVYGGGEV